MEGELISNHFNLDSMKNIKNLEEIKKLFNTLEELYYTNYKSERNDILKSTIMDLLKLIDSNLQNSNQLSKEEVSFLYLIKSFSLDKLPEYSKESEESASKSVKIKYITIKYK